MELRWGKTVELRWGVTLELRWVVTAELDCEATVEFGVEASFWSFLREFFGVDDWTAKSSEESWSFESSLK